MDPRAIAITAGIGALFYAGSHLPALKICFEGNKDDSDPRQLFGPAKTRKWIYDTLHGAVTGVATGVAYGILKYSKFNSTVGQTMAGVFIGFGAKLVVDLFYLPSKDTNSGSLENLD